MKLRFTLILHVLAYLLWSIMVSAQIRYVDESRPSSGAGTSWATAYKTLAEAMNAANTNSSITEIHVARGTYFPTGNQSNTNRDSAFTIIRGGLKLLGGFPAGGGARDILANFTILSGDIATENVHTNNSIHIMVIAGLSTAADSVVVDGFHFQRGYANGSTSKLYNGQTIQKDRAGALAIWGCSNGQKVAIRNCSFRGNWASDAGGALFVNASQPLIRNCLFSGNIADYGGAATFAATSPATLIHCTFGGNHRRVVGGGTIRNSSSNPVFINCIIQSNAEGISNNNASPFILYSLIQGIDNGNNGNIPGTTNPQFRSAVSHLDAPTLSGNYRLTAASPCINVGSDEAMANPIGVDLDGVARRIGCTTDMGAYEFTTPPDIPTINSDNIGNRTLCAGGSTSFTVSGTNATIGYGWQVNTGSGYTFLTNGGNYSGVNTPTLQISNVTPSMSGFQYRCLAIGCPPAAVSAEATLTVLPTTLYVDASIPASGDGASWATAFKTLGEALTTAHQCTSAAVNIYVAQGTYYPTGSQNATDRNTSFTISRGNIKIYGGYSSGGAIRAISVYPTILSGDIGTLNNHSDNSYHVMVIAGLPTAADSVVLDGFTFTRGNADGTSQFVYNGQLVGRAGGGAIALYANANANKVSISQCNFLYNNASFGGGALDIRTAGPAISNCRFENNSAEYGGAVYHDKATTVFTGCVFLNNTAGSSGGALASDYDSQCSLTSCQFEANKATNYYGGSLYNTNNSNMAIAHCQFYNSQAKQYGGAIANWQGVMQISDAIVSGNSVQQYDGGGIYSTGSLTITTSQVVNNTANYGGALSSRAALTATNCLFSGNLAAYGGGIDVSNNGAGVVVTNCTVAGNRATTQAAVYCSGTQPVVVQNSIIYGNSHGVFYASTAPLYAHCLVQGGSGGGAQDLNPFFVNPYVPAMAPNGGGNYRVSNCSPAVNGGNNSLLPAGITTDLDGNGRIYEGTVDIGAYEFQSAKAPEPFIANQPSNTNACVGASAMFTIGVGNSTGLQWQVNTGNGFTNITNATSGSITISPVTQAMQDYRYRCVVTGTCNRTVISTEVSITALPAPVITTQPAATLGCSTGSTVFSIQASHATSFHWQVNTGSGFSNLTNNSIYSGVNTATLTLTNITSSLSGYSYRCVASGNCAPSAVSEPAVLTVLPARLYVDASVSSSGNGFSWGTAYKTLHEALLAAHTCPVVTEIWLKEGNYVATAYPLGSTGGASNEDFAFSLRNGLGIYGGFTGIETSIGERVAGKTSTLTGVSGLNRNHVVIAVNVDNTAVLDGITIANGQSYFPSGSINFGSVQIPRSEGAGLYCYASSPTLNNCVFANNRTFSGNGAAVYNNASSPTFNQCRFNSNFCESNAGAAAYNAVGSMPVFNQCSFTLNRSNAGTVFNDASSASVLHCTFSDNYSGSGAGIYNNASSPVIRGCTFINNSAAQGTAILNSGGAPVISQCVFSGNNSFNSNGGAITSFDWSTPTLTNSVFVGNRALYSGGALHGGSSSAITVVNCTFFDNRANYGSTISAGNATVTIQNSIIWGRHGYTDPVFDLASSTIDVSHSTVDQSVPYYGTGNSNANPLFKNSASPAGTDGVWGTNDDGLMIDDCSPALNAGNNAYVPAGVVIDITGNPRIVATRVDMGAYEVQNAQAGAIVQYRDQDGDGFGNPANSITACTLQPGYVTNNTDCNDNDPLEKPGQIWYKDVDNDGYSDGTSLTQCNRPPGYKVAAELTAYAGDCNDANADIHPGATEICDGIDNNCNGIVDDVAESLLVLPVTNATVTRVINAGSTQLFTEGCQLVSKITSQGPNPVQGALEAKVWVHPQPLQYNNKPLLSRHYELSPQVNGAQATALVTLYFTQAEFDAFNAVPFNGPDLPSDPDDVQNMSNFAILKFPGTSSDNSGLPGSYAGVPQVIPASSLQMQWNAQHNWWEVSFETNGFSAFFAGSFNNSILPLGQLLSFNATLQGNTGVLQWTAAPGHSFKLFEVQKSTDGIAWYPIRQVAGATAQQKYIAYDHQLTPGVQYYRLRITESDGTIIYSTIRNLKGTGKNGGTHVFPNPISAGGNITIESQNHAITHWRLFNAAGNVVMASQGRLPYATRVSTTLRVGLLPGVYMLQVHTSGGIETHKVLVQ